MRPATAPAGAIVSLYVDLPDHVHEHDIIETRTGRRYEVITVRVQPHGKNAGRQHLSARVMADDELTYDGMQPDHPTIPKVHRIRWYKRKRGAGVKGRDRR